MATWAKVKFFYKTMLGSEESTLTATSTESTGNYNVNNLHNFFVKGKWKAEDSGLADPQYITYDAGSGNSFDADYLIIYKHNLNTAGATVALQYSSTGAWAGEEVTIFSEAPSADTVYIKRFAAPGPNRYWRLKISGHGGTAPFMSICVWGEEVDLSYVTSSMDPHGDNIKANTNITVNGEPAGIHEKFINREFTLTFDAADTTLYDKLRTWRDNHGLKQLFIAWEIANNPEDVFLMRPGQSAFKAPWTSMNSDFRNISIPFVGLKEAL